MMMPNMETIAGHLSEKCSKQGSLAMDDWLNVVDSHCYNATCFFSDSNSKGCSFRPTVSDRVLLGGHQSILLSFMIKHLVFGCCPLPRLWICWMYFPDCEYAGYCTCLIPPGVTGNLIWVTADQFLLLGCLKLTIVGTVRLLLLDKDWVNR